MGHFLLRKKGQSIEPLEPRRLLAAAIKPDIMFGNDGFADVTEPNTDASAAVQMLAIGSDGKIAALASFDADNAGWAIDKFNSDGSPDTSFGTSGVYSTGNGDDAFDGVELSDGSFIVGVDLSDNKQVGLTHVTADGKLDQSFGTNGLATATIQVSSDGEPDGQYYDDSIAVGPNGRIVVSTTVGISDSGTNDEQETTLLRFKNDGSPDTSFGTDGQIATEPNDHYGSTQVAVDSQNRIILLNAYSDGDGSYVSRYNADGLQDMTFDGFIAPEIGKVDDELAISLALQSDGKVLVGGQGRIQTDEENTQEVDTIVRLTTDGEDDSTFGTDGVASIDSGTKSEQVDHLLQDPVSGKILLDDEGGAVGRLNLDGSLDTTFGKGGIITVPSTAGADDVAGPMAVDSSDHIYLGLQQVTRLAPRPNAIQGKSGTLYVQGSAEDDTINVTESGSTITLDRDGATSTYTASSNFAVNISVDQKGNDTIDIAPIIPATITAGDGNDSITSGDGATTITTGNGNDVITVGNGTGFITFGDGTDTITAGNGKLVVQGGAGDDVYNLGSGGKTVYDTGGNNTVTSSGGNAKIVLDFGDSSGNNIVNTLSAHQKQRIGTGNGNDSITTAGSDDDIFTAGGNDTVSASAGDDTINGGNGNDLIIGGSGDDSLIGLNGRDTLKGEAGNDYLTAFPPGEYGSARDAFYGGDGNDTVTGAPGRDTIFGQDGDDVLNGAGGNDRIVGGSGIDQFFGGKGNDSIDSADGNAETVDGGSGENTSIAHDSNDHLINLS